ncbi:phospholipase A2 inhibitor and Ly6/PLAUR domain-containing protein-like [Pelodiscus sinensis]|uniref:phospholipase A2 inhibitor and Ly6/PLAUR domain-containing protein-like n=1 Tax=Pelodiscus sinensis TaxID=13735 RepID=UPI003F6CA8DD
MGPRANSPHGGTPATGYVKGCLPNYNSGIKGPLTLTVGRGLYLRLNTSRCNATEKCNTALLAVPQENSTLNGLQCPACLARNASACTGQAILCTGEETYCIDFTGEIIKGSSLSPFAAKGCASASAQDIESGTFLTAGNSRYLFGQATSVPAERAPTTTPPPTTSLPSTPLPTTATTSGTSLAPGQVPFALCLPGLTGLLLVKLLS